MSHVGPQVDLFGGTYEIATPAPAPEPPAGPTFVKVDLFGNPARGRRWRGTLEVPGVNPTGEVMAEVAAP